MEQIAKLLEEYIPADNKSQNLETAKKFVKDNLVGKAKSTVTQAITYDVREHFRLEKGDITILKQYWAECVTCAELEARTRAAEEAAANNGTSGLPGGKEPKEIIIPFDWVATTIMQEYEFFCMADTQEFYIYENGVFLNENSETRMKKLAREVYKIIYAKEEKWINDNDVNPEDVNEPNKKFTEEVLEKLRIDKSISRHEIDRIQSDNKHLINLKNGVYNIRTGTLEKHSPDHRFIRQIPVIYDKNATCPHIDKFLSEVVKPEDAKVLVEFAGYAMIPDTRIQKAFLLFGDGSNGKSIFLRLIEYFLGDKNISHESLQKLEEDKFAVANMYGKLVNIYADLRNSVIEHDDKFKTIVGGDILRGERKYQHAFEYNNTARLIFSANTQNIPKIRKDDFAYFRRWILIKFETQFLDGDELNDGVKPEKIDDKDLITKLTTPEELSGFLNIAIEGLKQVMKAHKFSYSKSISEVEEMYKLNSSSVSFFAESCLTIGTEDIEKAFMYSTYCGWCDVKGVKKMAANAFGKEMKRLGYNDARPYNNDTHRKESVWECVCIDLEKLNFELTGKHIEIQESTGNPENIGLYLGESPSSW